MDRPKVGLALGSGAARGFAHVGVMKVLKENNIPIDYIAGSSIGAIIGALFSSGADLDKLANLLKYLPRKYFYNFSPTAKGLVSTEKIDQLLKLFIRVEKFSELNIPLSVVASDLRKGERFVFTEGNLLKAIRASMAIPGIFSPVNFEGRMLVDGGLTDRLPAGVVKRMGADVIIGVDVGFQIGDDYHPKNILDIILQAIGILEVQLLKKKSTKCDVLIVPEVAHLSPYSIENIDESIESGIAAAKASLDKIKALIEDSAQSRQVSG